LTAMSSKKAMFNGLRSTAVTPAPAALLRTSAPCCAASDDSDLVELQLKVRPLLSLLLNLFSLSHRHRHQ
jgi:hypothetical protein